MRTYDEAVALFAEALSRPAGFSGWEDLHSCFRHVLPPEGIALLLRHPNEEAVLGGLYLAGELYDLAQPVAQHVIALTHADSPRIRQSAYDATYSIFRCGRDGIVALLRGLSDKDTGCRTWVMLLLADSPPRSLQDVLASPQVQSEDINTGVYWLVHGVPAEYTVELPASQVLRRLYAIALVRHMQRTEDSSSFLRRFDDEDIVAFMKEHGRLQAELRAAAERRNEARQRWRRATGHGAK